MVIHRSHLDHAGVPTRTSTIRGYLWGRQPCRTIAYNFDAEEPTYENTIYAPCVDVEGAFSQPSVSQGEVFDTFVRVADHTLLISAYFDARLYPNPNVTRDFPHFSWRGEIGLLFVGKRKAFIKRAPPDSVVRSVMARYMGLCIAHVELGTQFPGYITIEGSLSNENILVD